MTLQTERCCVCGKFITQDGHGVWIDARLVSDCQNPTGMHQTEPSLITVASHAEIAIGESLTLPENTVMFVVAVDQDHSILSMSGLMDRRRTPELIAGLRGLADRWEQEYYRRAKATLN